MSKERVPSTHTGQAFVGTHRSALIMRCMSLTCASSGAPKRSFHTAAQGVSVWGTSGAWLNAEGGESGSAPKRMNGLEPSTFCMASRRSTN